MTKAEQLNADADALDRTAAVADYFTGLAAETDPVHSDDVAHEAIILRNWAALSRLAAASA